MASSKLKCQTAKQATAEMVSSPGAAISAIVTSGQGYALQPEIVIPEDAISVTVGNDGEVSVRLRGEQNIFSISGSNHHY